MPKYSFFNTLVAMAGAAGSSLFAGDKTVEMVTVNWPPYYAESLDEGGPVVEITREAFNRVGYKLKMTWTPWKRAQILVKEGHFIGLFGPYYTPERDKYALYTEENVGLVQSTVMTTDQSSIKAKSLRDLTPYTVCNLRGTSVASEYDKAGYIKKFEANSEKQCVRMLFANRVDAIAGNPFVFRLILKEVQEAGGIPKKSGLKNALVLSENKLRHAFSRKIPGHEKIRSDLDKGLKIIRKDGTFKTIMRKHGMVQ